MYMKTYRLKKSNKMQQYADICLLLNYSTCFGRPSRPSSGVHKTVVAASGTNNNNNNNNNIYCSWVVTRWQWLFYMYTKYEIGY